MQDEQVTEGGPLTLREASAYLKISPNTLYKWTSRGTIAHYKPNGRVLYFKKADLDAWVFRNRNTPSYEMVAIPAPAKTKGGR